VKKCRTKVLSGTVFALSICIGLQLGSYTAKADTSAGGQQDVILKSATTLSTKKTIKIPKRVTVSSQSYSRGGFTGGAAFAEGDLSLLMETAYNQIGKPYVWGGNGPNVFDCSGFTVYCYKAIGVTLPRVAEDQAKVGAAVSKENLKPGDLIFFNTNGKNISHVGMYVGNGEFIHASSGSGCITVSQLSNSYYTRTYVGARRILK